MIRTVPLIGSGTTEDPYIADTDAGVWSKAKDVEDEEDEITIVVKEGGATDE